MSLCPDFPQLYPLCFKSITEPAIASEDSGEKHSEEAGLAKPDVGEVVGVSRETSLEELKYKQQ